MKSESLSKITESLECVFLELQSFGIHDNNIRHRYAEFLVASKLAKLGHTVQLLGNRQDKDADIYLDDVKKRVEVKSGKCSKDNWAYASFGKGYQISKNRFDYCAFVTFAFNDESVKDIFIFSREELLEVAKIRKDVARYPLTNPCGLMWAPSRKDLNDYVRSDKIKAWDIEKKLCASPDKYRNAWHKIKK